MSPGYTEFELASYRTALRARVAVVERENGELRAMNEGLRARVAELEAALRFLVEGTKWKSADRDNMEFEGRVNCYQLDRARAALAQESGK